MTYIDNIYIIISMNFIFVQSIYFLTKSIFGDGFLKKYFKTTMCILSAGLMMLSGCKSGSENESAGKESKTKDYDIFIYNGDTSIGKSFREMCDEYTKRTGVIIRTVTPTQDDNTIENLDSYINSEYPPDIFTVSSIDELEKWQQVESIWDFNNATEENFKNVVNKIPSGLRLSSNTSDNFGVPTTVQGHGFIVDPKMIASLFGGDKYLKVLNDLQNCSYEEFNALVDALSSYISSGSASEVTLNSKTYSFSATRGELSEKLKGVFSIPAPDAKVSGSYLMNPILASIFSSPAEAVIADENQLSLLENPLNKYTEMLDMISTYTAGASGILSRGTDYISSSKNGITPSIKNFINGKSVFLLGSTTDYDNISVFDVSVAKRCVFVPIKSPVTDYDISSSNKTVDKNLSKSLNLSVPRYYCINAKSSSAEKKAAQDFLVWLKTSDLAQKYVVSEFGYVPYDIEDGSVLDNALNRSMATYIKENKILPAAFQGAPEGWCDDVGKKIISSLLSKVSWNLEDYSSVAEYGIDKWKKLKS